MDSLISVRRQDDAFFSYLKGTFSNEWRAIPTESLNLEVKKDYITFRLVPVERVPQVGVWNFLWRVLRLEGLSLSLGGLLAALVYLQVLNRPVNVGIAIACFLPVACLHIAMNLFNDYYDHIKGVDRIGAVKSIQMGLVRAIDLYYWGWAILSLGLATGLSVLVVSPQPTYLIVALAGFGILEFSSNRLGLKYLGYGELTLFLLTGPLLVVGYIWTVTPNIEVRDLLLGVLLGTLTVAFMHLNNLREILSASQAGVDNFATRWGFDKGKKFAGIIFALAALLWWGLLILMHKSAWSFGPWLAGLALLKYIFMQIIQSPSPMASLLRQVVRKKFLLHTLLLALIFTSFVLP